MSELSAMLTRDNIALGQTATDWQEAVRRAGELLVKSGAVEPRYVPAMMEMVKEIGPYIVIAPGVALPHARPEEGVLRPCMSLVTLVTPVEFGNEFNDPVDLLVAFGAPDQDGHLKALTGLARLLENSDTLARIRQASDVEEVFELIKGH